MYIENNGITVNKVKYTLEKKIRRTLRILCLSFIRSVKQMTFDIECLHKIPGLFQRIKH